MVYLPLRKLLTALIPQLYSVDVDLLYWILFNGSVGVDFDPRWGIDSVRCAVVDPRLSAVVPLLSIAVRSRWGSLCAVLKQSILC